MPSQRDCGGANGGSIGLSREPAASSPCPEGGGPPPGVPTTAVGCLLRAATGGTEPHRPRSGHRPGRLRFPCPGAAAAPAPTRASSVVQLLISSPGAAPTTGRGWITPVRGLARWSGPGDTATLGAAGRHGDDVAPLDRPGPRTLETPMNALALSPADDLHPDFVQAGADLVAARLAQQAKDTPAHRAAVARERARIDAVLDLYLELSDPRGRDVELAACRTVGAPAS